MDTELLRTFLEVNKTRHFGRASENLYLTQAAVSARVKQLESQLGVPLFIRARNNIQLTIEGERLVPHAETILLAWSRVKQDVALKPEQKQQINIGTTAGLWNFVLQDRIPQIHRDMPGLALRADAHTSDELLRLVQDNLLDVAVLYEPVQAPELSAQPLGKLKLVLASTAVDANAQNAMDENYVYVDWGTTFALFHAKRFGNVPPALHTNMAAVAESFIAEHPGAAYLPEILLRSNQSNAAHSSLKLVIDAPSFTRDVYAVYRTNTERETLLKNLLPYLNI